MVLEMATTVIEGVVQESIELVKKAGYNEYMKALYSFMDTVAVAAAGYRLDDRIKMLIKNIGGLSGGKFTVLGEWRTGTDLMKALTINSFSAHTLELDDWLGEGFIHVGSTIVPTSISISQELDLSLEEALEALIFGYEIAGRMGAFLGRKHYRLWHTTATVGGMAAAAVIAWLKGFSEEKIVNSIVTAGSYASGILPIISKNVGIKPISTSHGAVIGLLSTSIQQCITHPKNDYSNIEKILCKAFKGSCEKRKALNPSWDYAINKVGYKVFPSCRNSHTAIQTALKLREKVNPREIARIEVEIFEEAYQVADIIHPVNIDEAKFSLTFLIAASLVKGWPGFEEIEQALKDPLVYELEEKTTIRVREDFTEAFPNKQPVRIIITLKNGEKIEDREDTPLGDPTHPLSERNLFKKAMILSAYAGDEKLAEIINILIKKNLNIKINEIFV